MCVCACVCPCGGGWLVHHAEGPRVTYCRSWALQGEMGGEGCCSFLNEDSGPKWGLSQASSR